MGQYVTPAGLQIPTVEDILDELVTEQRQEIDPELNTSADSPIGQQNGIFASHLREAYEVLQVAWNGNDPDAAESTLLENLSAITGTQRQVATRSRFVGTRKLTVNLSAGATIPALTTQFKTPTSATLWRTTEEKTADAGTGEYQVSAECVETGPIPCNANTLTVIATPVLGLNSVTNDFDAELGAEADNDEQLWQRRENELRATGSATVDALHSDLLAIKLDNGLQPVQEVLVLENETDTIDVNGLPPHSLECLVYDGVSQDCPNNTIAQTIWDSKPAGIQMIGSSSGTATDKRGNSRTVPFTRPTLKEVLIKATLVLTNAGEVPADYLTLVQAAVIAQFGKKVRSGSVIRANHYEAACLAIQGIEDASVQMSFAPDALGSPGANLTLGLREIGFVQTSGITVA